MPCDASSSRIEEELAAVDRLIRQRIESEIGPIGLISDHLLESSGKRLRPKLLLLSCATAGYRGQQHILVAAIIEFIHTATLLHDDVIDRSDRRRGQRSANHIWGNSVAVLMGDFLYSRAFEMMVEAASIARLMPLLSSTTNRIAEGELLQLSFRQRGTVSEAEYRLMIGRKTAELFAAATRLGGIMAGIDRQQEEHLACYGYHLGMAFQMLDDMLDYVGDSEDMGKSTGADLSEHKFTLPLIQALQLVDKKEHALLRQAIAGDAGDRLLEVSQILKRCGALAYSQQAAASEIDKATDALQRLPTGQYRDMLQIVAEDSLHRHH